MQRMERSLIVVQVIVAGLAAGVIAGLAVHMVVADPAVLTGGAIAFAGDPTTHDPTTNDLSPVRTPGAVAPPAGEGTPATSVAEDPTRRLPTYARERFSYASLGRRDPFQALVGGEFETDGDVGLPDVADLRLVGIAWDAADRFAMAEDSRGFGYVLRLGDKIRGGKVARIARDSVTFAQYTAGELSTITLELPLQEDAR